MKNEAREVVASTSSESAEPDVGRRNMALAMFGALGAAVAVGARGSTKAVVDVKPEPPVNTQGAPPTTGTEIMWVDTVFGSGGPKSRANGDLNKGPRALSASAPPMVVIACGAVTPGDGGGGIFFWKADPQPVDDGGTKIIPQILVPASPNAPAGAGSAGPPGNGQGNGPGNNQGNGPPEIIIIPPPKNPDTHKKGYWQRLYDGPLNVKWFGTGTYSQIGIQAAIDAAANTEGGSVYIPPGTYDIRETIEVKSKVELRGAGPATILRLTDGVDVCQALQFKASVIKVQGGHNIRIADLQVDGNKDNNPANGHWNTQDGILVRHGLESDPLDPMRHFTVPAKDILIENCIAGNSTGHGIGVISSHRVTLRNCMTNDCGSVDAAANGIDFSWQPSPFGDPLPACQPYTEVLYGLPPSLEDCVAEGCTAYRNPHVGMESWGTHSLRTTFRNCHTDMILINVGDRGGQEATVEAMVLDCTVDHSQRNVNDEPINATEASGVLIANCRLIANEAGVKFLPIDPPAARGNTIVGNTIIYVGTYHPAAGTYPPRAGLVDPDPRSDCDLPPHQRTKSQIFGAPGGPAAGILAVNQQDLVIANNTVTGFRETITVWTCTDVVVAKNTTSAGTIGVYLLNGTSNTAITKNSIRECTYGVYEDATCSENVYAYNILRGNVNEWNTSDGPGPNFPQRSEHNMI